MPSSRMHFADPLHPLLNKPHRHEPRNCSICLFSLTGFKSHHCNTCHIHIHDACADYFEETILFFAHPWHTLKLRRIHNNRFCDLCTENCPAGSFVYSCITCSFDVHPLCSKLPQSFRSTLHPGHDLLMLPSSGTCAACQNNLPVWNYRCTACYFKLHITCASNAPTGGSNHAASSCQASYGGSTAYSNHAAVSHGRYGAQSDIVATPSLLNYVAKFLLRTSFHIAVNAAAGGLPLADILSAILGC